MRVESRPGELRLSDAPGLYWLLGLLFVGLGAVAVAAPLGLATNAGDLPPWGRLASVAMGLSLIGGGAWTLLRAPYSRVRLDVAGRCGAVIRAGVAGRSVQRFDFAAVAEVDVEATEDDEGHPIYRPVLRLQNGDRLPLSLLWQHHRPAALAATTVVAKALDLTAPR